MNVLRRIWVPRSLGVRYRSVLTVLFLQLCATTVETFGVTMLLPLFELIANGGTPPDRAASMLLWRILDTFFQFVGLTLNVQILSVAVVLAIFSRMIFVYFRQVYMARFRYNLIRDIRNRAFGNYLGVELEKGERITLGGMVNDITVESTRAITSLCSMIEGVGIILMIAVYTGLLVVISPQMTGALVVLIFFELFAIRWLMRRSHRESRASIGANKAFSVYLTERLAHFRHIQLSQTQQAELDTVERLTGNQFRRYFNISCLAGYTNFVVQTLIVLTVFALFYAGLEWFALTLPTLMIFSAAALRDLMLIQAVAMKLQTTLSNVASFEAIENLLDELGASEEGLGGSVEFSGVDRGIRVEGVSFAYASRSDVAALSDVTLEIGAGELTAIVGPSGAGKSTLIDLLPRLRHPTQGRITIDDVGLEEYELNSLRRGIAYVPQEPQVFNVAIKDHIGYGNPLGDMSAVREAADLAGASSFIEKLPKGYETMLGEAGIELSGGQRQRLDLARALMRQAPILILDEPASRLDAEAEQGVREALKRIRARGVTVIVVAHRFTTVADADRIIVLEGGRISATGNHDELIGEDGWYARALRQQSHPGELAATPEIIGA